MSPLRSALISRIAAVLVLAPAAVPSLQAQEAPKAHSFRDALTLDKTPLDRNKPLGNSWSPILKRVAPAVVTIKTGVATVRRRAMTQDEAMLRYFFGLGGNSMPELEEQDGRGGKVIWQQIGLGTGVLVTKDGYIITNRHVVLPQDSPWPAADLMEALRLKVVVPGREGELDARLIDYSLETDIAVIKVNSKDLPCATLADSDAVEVGDKVFAVGAPFGMQSTVTDGCISARRNDEVLAGMDKQELLQTDAAINPGNSGGPLFDCEGRVIGINTAIYTRSGGNMGIGFAIPINKAISAADALSRPRGWLGVGLDPMRSARIASYFKIKGGAVITELTPDGPAAKAGLAVEDIIHAVDGKPVTNDDELRKAIASRTPGSEMTLGVVRLATSQKTEVTVKLAARANQFDAAKAIEGSEPAPAGDALVGGMKLGTLTPELRTRLAVPETENGLVVLEVAPDSPAAMSGVEANDILLRVDGETPASAEAVGAALRNSPTGVVRLHIRHGNSVRRLMLETARAGE